LSFQANVGATPFMSEIPRKFYMEAADPITGAQQLEKGKD